MKTRELNDPQPLVRSMLDRFSSFSVAVLVLLEEVIGFEKERMRRKEKERKRVIEMEIVICKEIEVKGEKDWPIYQTSGIQVPCWRIAYYTYHKIDTWIF